MKIYQASEKEIDVRLELNRAHDQRAFCRNFEPEEKLPPKFYSFQDKIIHDLVAVLNSKYENGGDGAGSWEWNLFYIPQEPIPSERILIEVSSEILDDKLIGLILPYLEKNAASY